MIQDAALDATYDSADAIVAIAAKMKVTLLNCILRIVIELYLGYGNKCVQRRWDSFFSSKDRK